MASGPTPAQIAAFNANLAHVNSGVPNNGLPAGYSAGAISPTNPDGGVYTPPASGGGSGITVGVNDPGTLALYQQQIGQYNQALQGLPTQLQGSQNQIQGAYQDALSKLIGAKNDATAGYNTSTTGNKQNYVTQKNTIGTNAGQSLNGLLRLLGSRGAGGSSAALFSAPNAVATQATQQRGAAGQTYGANQSNLDTTYNTYLRDNQNDVNSIGSQRDLNLNSAQAQEQSQAAGLQQQLAQLHAQYAAAQGGNAAGAAAPYLSQAQNYLNSAGQLGLKTFTPSYNTAAYTAPTAASYAASQFASPTAGNPSQGVTNNTISPAFQALLKPKLSGVAA